MQGEGQHFAARWYVPPDAFVNASRAAGKPATKRVIPAGNTAESVAIPLAALGHAKVRDWFWVRSVVHRNSRLLFTESS